MDIENLFLTVWNMSLTGSIIICFVLLARCFLRKSPRVFSYALWSVVLFRLLCPVSVSSVFSVLNFTKASEPVSQSVVTTMDYSTVEIPALRPAEVPQETLPAAEEWIPERPEVVTSVVPAFEQEIPQELDAVVPQTPPVASTNPVWYAAVLWLLGLGVMLIYNICSCVRLFQQIDGAVPLRNDLYLADHIPTAFVLGVIKPRIYLPSYLAVEERGYIIAHERCHIKRKDHVFRLLAYLALCIHWFNPLVWLAFSLSGKDMEMSCDETVIQMYGPRIRAEYAQSLLRVATGRRSFTLTPLAFGEGDTKERVINMSKWKKPKTWATIGALIACVAVLVACAMNPSTGRITGFSTEKELKDACIQSIAELTEGESHCILHEQELSGDVRKTEYRRYDKDQLVLVLEEATLDNRIYADGKYGAAYDDAWVWEGMRTDYDANEWLREWSPEQMVTDNWSSTGDEISFDATWDHPLHAERQCSGQLTFTFRDGMLESVHREYFVMEGTNRVGGSIETITVLDEPAEETQRFIRSVADRCITKEESLQQEKQLKYRDQVKVNTVDGFLAAIAPDREIILDAGTYDLGQAADYGKTANSDYYFWTDMSDGYELTIRGVSNLVIRGAGMHVTTIETLPRYADVLNFQECSDIKLSDFTAGHTDGYGECGAGVVYLQSCDRVEMSQLGLYGCGCVGLETEYGTNITLRDSDIYDCSSSAAVLRNTYGVEISDCRIYRIGHELYGGYCIFEVTDCEGVRIDGCEIYDSRTANLLCALRNQNNVWLKNNLIRNNRFEEAAMTIQGCDVTLETNQFLDNSIRNWYKLSSNTAVDEQNKTLTEEVLNEMYGGKPDTSTQPQLEIHVSTVDELLAAIGPNKKIVLDAANYDLSTATGYGWTNDTYYYWQKEYDGFGLVIRDVDNMTICGSGKDVKTHTIVAVPRWANVLMFRSCSNITVTGFTAGHTQGQGSCTGGVLRFEDSDHILVDNCGLFGCGTKGVDTDDCADVTVKNSEIYECSEGGIEMRDTNGIILENNTFRDIAGRYYLALIGCMDATMDGKTMIPKDIRSDCYLADDDQIERNALNDAVSNFVYNYFWDNQEEMQKHLAESYEGDGGTYNDGESSYKGMHYEITSGHVSELMQKGSVTIEIPYRPYEFEDGEKYEIIRQLAVTVVKENGEYKISDYQQKG